jgi:hypothetical protein
MYSGCEGLSLPIDSTPHTWNVEKAEVCLREVNIEMMAVSYHMGVLLRDNLYGDEKEAGGRVDTHHNARTRIHSKGSMRGYGFFPFRKACIL